MNKYLAPDAEGTAAKLPARSEVPVEMTWDLSDIYASKEAWDADVAKMMEMNDRLATYAGRLGESAQVLLEALRLYEAMGKIMELVEEYAMMSHDQDVTAPEGQELYGRYQTLIAKYYEQIAFLQPEILAFPEGKLEAFTAQEPDLKYYDVTLREIVRMAPHTLSSEMEALLASALDLSGTPSNCYGMLVNGDLKFPTVKHPTTGEDVQISNGRFVPIQSGQDRALRKTVFEAFYTRYKEFGNTWAAMYEGQVKASVFFAKARKYPSSFVAAVDEVNVDPAVCDHLIASVHEHGLERMHRYVRLRKKLLGVDELHMYDVYAPMVKDYEAKYPYELAKEISLKALAPLGEDYLELMRKAYDERWIDVMESEGKRGGAYSSGPFGVHPYMLLNYNNTLDDVFTLVHEMGHSIHTWYSDHNRSFLDSQYTIFVAEVASTTNEVLLLEYMLKNAQSREEKAALINHLLESFKGTLFRQTMFEEFERKTHAMYEAGEPLTFDRLCRTYLDLNKEYFGPDMVSDDLIACEWCRIPHFYMNFYVYQYATSFSAAVAIAHRILEQGAPVVEKYKEFLKSGCTKSPVELLKIAGVDLSGPEPVNEALDVFEQAIIDMENL